MVFRSVVLAAALVCAGIGGSIAAPVLHSVATLRGVKTDLYQWTDSHGRPRSVYLKREGQGNSGHGGYAIRMTYQIRVGAVWRTIVADEVLGSGDGGFGYFVSHERYRDFADGANDTIASKIFGADDSPLGLQFPVSAAAININANAKAHRFQLFYPRYGTRAPIPKNADGEDVSPTPTSAAAFQRYLLPVTITWVFQNGKDYPRISIKVSLARVPGPDLVNFDLRAPYGVLNFDNGANNPISTVMWGDRFHFVNLSRPLTRNSTWRWTGANSGDRYTALIAGQYEMGLLEPRTFATSRIPDGYAFGRGMTSSQYRCEDQDEALPCDWEWPYQSAQYSLPYDDNDAPTTFEKIAWGSAPYWGTGPSMTRIFDTDNSSEAFNGFPGNKLIAYDICVVLGRTVAGGLTKLAAAGPNYNCAAVPVP